MTDIHHTPMKTRLVKTTFYIPEGLLTQLKAEADSQDRKTSEVIRDAIRTYLAAGRVVRLPSQSPVA